MVSEGRLSLNRGDLISRLDCIFKVPILNCDDIIMLSVYTCVFLIGVVFVSDIDYINMKKLRSLTEAIDLTSQKHPIYMTYHTF